MRCYNRRAAPVAHRVWWGVGKTKGYPIYFPLAVHERIVSAWVCGCGSTFTDVGTGPYLLVSTNFGRTRSFKPYLITARESVR
ncbi:hypothetical protein VUR80DRAFT_3734 [Thermomyces stellatus]